MLRIGTLFSGGLAAVEWAMKYEEFEHEVVFACEWDKYARKQYLAFHGEPSSCFYEDVSDMKGHKYLDTIDLMVWGSPCQDLSLAGKRKGFNGEKSSLFRDGARIMSEVMPKVFIFENVKGLLSSNGGADYKEVVKTFQDLGYLIAMKVVNAKEQGTAQNRERVFVVGFLDEDAYHNFSFADNVPLTKCLRDYLEEDVDEKYYLSEKMIKGFIHKDNNFQGSFSVKDLDNDVANCLDTKEGNRRTNNFVKSKMKIQAFHSKSDSHCACITARYHKCGITDPYIKEPILNQVGELDIKGADSTKRVYSVDGICPTMTTMGRGNRQPKVLLPTLEVGVKSATKSGYEVATENDSINFTHPDSKTRRGRVGKGVAQTLDCACNQGVIIGAIRGRNPDNPKSRVAGLPTQQMLELNENGTANCLTSVQKDNVVVESKINVVGSVGGANESNSRIYGIDGISPTLLAGESGGGQNPVKHLTPDFRIRRLTPRECFRLMGMRDEDIVLVNSDTQSYKIAGNGIEINTMRSIIRQLYKPVKSSLSLF